MAAQLQIRLEDVPKVKKAKKVDCPHNRLARMHDFHAPPSENVKYFCEQCGRFTVVKW